jgi:hypothetical protein
MGCNFQTMTVPGSASREDVVKAFDQAQDQDRYENGHNYSGGFGMARGLTFESHTFYSRETAEEWLDRNAQKWESAIAVRFKDTDGVEQWMIGANCAS